LKYTYFTCRLFVCDQMFLRASRFPRGNTRQRYAQVARPPPPNTRPRFEISSPVQSAKIVQDPRKRFREIASSRKPEFNIGTRAVSAEVSPGKISSPFDFVDISSLVFPAIKISDLNSAYPDGFTGDRNRFRTRSQRPFLLTACVLAVVFNNKNTFRDFPFPRHTLYMIHSRVHITESATSETN